MKKPSRTRERRRSRSRSSATPGAAQGNGRGFAIPSLARALGVGERTLYRLREDGVIVPMVFGKGRRPATYDLAVVARALLARPESARDERDRAQADLLRLRVDRERRALLPAAGVAREGRGIVQTATARLLKLPSDLVRTGVVPQEREELVEAVVREALDELSRLTAIGGES